MRVLRLLCVRLFLRNQRRKVRQADERPQLFVIVPTDPRHLHQLTQIAEQTVTIPKRDDILRALPIDPGNRFQFVRRGTVDVHNRCDRRKDRRRGSIVGVTALPFDQDGLNRTASTDTVPIGDSPENQKNKQTGQVELIACHNNPRLPPLRGTQYATTAIQMQSVWAECVEDRVTMRIFLSAGEQSGDLHGAAVARELLRLAPETELAGLGGGRMESAGVEILYPLPRLALIGFIEVAKHLPSILRVRRLVRKSWEKKPPDLIVLIDFPGFHLRLAALAKSMGIPVVYYIAPQMWAWGEDRAKVLRERVTRLLTILPFEERFFRRHHLDSIFVGHPLMDALGGIEQKAYKPIRPDKATIGLLPGSRGGELNHILPAMVEAARQLHEQHSELSFILPLAETLDESVLGGFSIPSWMEIVRDPEYKHRLRMDFAWTSSGTATVENAILGVPMIIVYKTGRLNAMIARRLVRVPYIGLANLIAGHGVFPELIQEQVCAPALVSWTLDFLEDDERQRIMYDGLRRIRGKLGPPGASNRAAQEILTVAECRSKI